MNLATFLRESLSFSRDMTVKLAEDLRDAPRTFPTPKGGNHPQWVMGHLTLAEDGLIGQFCLGKPHANPAWMETMGPGTTPVADAKAYPAYDELLAAFKGTRERTLRGLADMTDADFDKPAGAPEEFRHLLPTVGHCFMHALMHNAVHIGQLTDARRALGREPLLFNPKRVEAGAR